MLGRHPLVGRPPSADLPHHALHAGGVVHLVSAGAEVEAGQVPGQVFDADVVMGAVERPLELGEEVLHRNEVAELPVSIPGWLPGTTGHLPA